MNLLIVSDHPLTTFALSALVRHLDAHAEVHEARSLGAALRVLNAHDEIDLILLDLDMRGGGRVRALTLLNQFKAGAHLVVLSAIARDTEIVHAVEQGAMGYLHKTAPLEELLRSIVEVLAGRIQVPELDAFYRPVHGKRSSPAPGEASGMQTGRSASSH